jgi:hypothetical protein
MVAVIKPSRKAAIKRFQKRVAVSRKMLWRKTDPAPRPKFPKLLEYTWPDYISRA